MSRLNPRRYSMFQTLNVAGWPGCCASNGVNWWKRWPGRLGSIQAGPRAEPPAVSWHRVTGSGRSLSMLRLIRKRSKLPVTSLRLGSARFGAQNRGKPLWPAGHPSSCSRAFDQLSGTRLRPHITERRLTPRGPKLVPPVVLAYQCPTSVELNAGLSEPIELTKRIIRARRAGRGRLHQRCGERYDRAALG